MSNKNIIIDYKGDARRVPKILAQIDKYRYNPSGIQRVVLDYLRAVTNDAVDIVDPTNPFVFALESSAVSISPFIQDAKSRNYYSQTLFAADAMLVAPEKMQLWLTARA